MIPPDCVKTALDKVERHVAGHVLPENRPRPPQEKGKPKQFLICDSSAAAIGCIHVNSYNGEVRIGRILWEETPYE